MKEFHILALDGGGSKGLMQALILQDVMNATTVICQNPDRVKEILESINDPATAFFGKDTKSFSEEFIGEMKSILLKKFLCLCVPPSYLRNPLAYDREILYA